MRKLDGFGVEHRKGCARPVWNVALMQRRGVPAFRVQRCRGCGGVWRWGDASGSAQDVVGFSGAGS